MTRRRWSGLLLLAFTVGGIAVGYGKRHHARGAMRGRAPASPAPIAPSVGIFTDGKSGISVRYPAGWLPERAATAELDVAAPPQLLHGYASLSLDVPAMSWHPPFIPLGVVTSRYCEALKQNQVPDARVQETHDVTVPGASARRVTSVGHLHGQPYTDVAVVMVHKGQVYILSCDADAAGVATARKTLDEALASVRWTK